MRNYWNTDTTHICKTEIQNVYKRNNIISLLIVYEFSHDTETTFSLTRNALHTITILRQSLLNIYILT